MALRPARLPAVLGIATWLVASSVRAEEGEDGLRLTWDAPEGCPSEAHVRRAALQSARVEPARAGVLVADARVERKGKRWRVAIETSRGASARHLEASTCAALADATAVIVAGLLLVPAASSPTTNARSETAPVASSSAPTSEPTALEALGADPSSGLERAGAGHESVAPVGVVGRAVDGPSPVAVPSPTSRQPERPPAVPARMTGRASSRAFHAVVGGVVDGSSLPAAAAGGRVGVAWTPDRARIELGASYYASQSRTTAVSAAGAELGLLAIEGRGCWTVVSGALATVAPCGGVDVNLTTARGFGGLVNYDARAQWTSITAGGIATIPVARWISLRAMADAVVPVTRPEFVVEGDGAVHRPAVIGLRGEFGAEVHFP